MSFFEKLEDIRQRPAGARKRILFFSMIISMSVIITLWIGLLKYDGSKETSQNGPSPWQVIKNTFDISKKEIKDNLPGQIFIKEE